MRDFHDIYRTLLPYSLIKGVVILVPTGPAHTDGEAVFTRDILDTLTNACPSASWREKEKEAGVNELWDCHGTGV